MHTKQGNCWCHSKDLPEIKKWLQHVSHYQQDAEHDGSQHIGRAESNWYKSHHLRSTIHDEMKLVIVLTIIVVCHRKPQKTQYVQKSQDRQRWPVKKLNFKCADKTTGFNACSWCQQQSKLFLSMYVCQTCCWLAWLTIGRYTQWTPEDASDYCLVKFK